MERRKHFGRTFLAHDADGELQAIDVWSEFRSARTRGESAETVTDASEYRLHETGQVVRRLAQGRYEVVATGVRLRSDDPHVP